MLNCINSTDHDESWTQTSLCLGSWHTKFGHPRSKAVWLYCWWLNLDMSLALSEAIAMPTVPHTHTLSISILLLFEIRWIKPGVRQWGKASTFEASSLFRWFWLQPLMVESNDDYDNGYANHWQWKSLENVNWSENVFFIRLSNFVETFTEMEFANVWMAEAQEEQIDHLPLPSSLSLSRARSQPMSLSFLRTLFDEAVDNLIKVLGS